MEEKKSQFYRATLGKMTCEICLFGKCHIPAKCWRDCLFKRKNKAHENKRKT